MQALVDNWVGHEILQARAQHKAPKYGRDDDLADGLAYQVMELWTEETWKYRTQSTRSPVPARYAFLELLGGRFLHPACQP